MSWKVYSDTRCLSRLTALQKFRPRGGTKLVYKACWTPTMPPHSPLFTPLPPYISNQGANTRPSRQENAQLPYQTHQQVQIHTKSRRHASTPSGTIHTHTHTHSLHTHTHAFTHTHDRDPSVAMRECGFCWLRVCFTQKNIRFF